MIAKLNNIPSQKALQVWSNYFAKFMNCWPDRPKLFRLELFLNEVITILEENKNPFMCLSMLIYVQVELRLVRWGNYFDKLCTYLSLIYSSLLANFGTFNSCFGRNVSRFYTLCVFESDWTGDPNLKRPT